MQMTKKTKSKNQSQKKLEIKEEVKVQIKGIVLIALAVFCFFSLEYTQDTGPIGWMTNFLLRTLAGEAAIIAPVLLVATAFFMVMHQKIENSKARLVGVLLLSLLAVVAFHFHLALSGLTSHDSFYQVSLNLALQNQGGGFLGVAFSTLFYLLFRNIGSYIVMSVLGLISLLLITNVPFYNILKSSAQPLIFVFASLKKIFLSIKKALLSKKRHQNSATPESSPATKDIDVLSPENLADNQFNTSPLWSPDQNEREALENEERTAEEIPAHNQPYQSERTLQHREPEEGNQESQQSVLAKEGKKKEYQLPPVSLLAKPPSSRENGQTKDTNYRAQLLEETLHSFGVQARVINVTSGPTVTRFEVQPETGVKVSKIVNLSDDIALNLAAPDIRIEAPIPGKAALGIEVPNKIISLIYLREVLEHSTFKNNESPLSVAIGKDITGVPVVTSLEEMPHLLIAGATGSGKSVCLNSIVASILFKARPDQAKFLMIDPKMVELNIFDGIPHLVAPVVTDPKKSSQALKNMVKEMNRRYDLFAKAGARDITAYNQYVEEGKVEGDKLPFLVVIVDELADLMLVSPGEVEDTISRLAQMSRASGIHLVIATQRPSVDVITGIIKANITSRIAFTVSSQVDSRTILDMGGAEKLLGRGDMLFAPIGSVKPLRVQGAFISENDVEKLVDYVKQQGEEIFTEEMLTQETEEEEWEDVDELFPDAVELVVRTGQASISLLQRRFRVGYTRAARIMDDLENKGVVGEHEGSKPRVILLSPEEAHQIREDFKEKTL